MAKNTWWLLLAFMALGCSSGKSAPGLIPGSLDGVMADGWVSSLICDSEERVAGKAAARCSALDGPCQRSRYDAARACCERIVMPPGMVCSEIPASGEGGDLCDGFGSCRPAAEIPESPRAVGDRRWLEALGADGADEPAPIAWHLDDGTIEILFGERPMARIPGRAEGHRLRIAAGLDAGLVALDVPYGPDGLEISLFLPRRAGALSESLELCAAFGRSGLSASIGPDCSGGEVVACPSQGQKGIDCSLDERGYAVITARNLSQVWHRDVSQPPAPLLSRILEDPVGGQASLTAPAGRASGSGGGTVVTAFCRPLGETRACTYRRSCRGLQSCTSNGWGACKPLPELCDNQDQDCDGVVDEDADWACEDAAACTRDFCRAGVCHHDRGLFNLGQPGAACRNPARCSTAYCAPESLAVHDPRDSWTAPDANGCRLALRAAYCDERDHCVCDGKERCAPLTAGADPVTGCLAAPRGTTPGPLGHHSGCDMDGDRCTQEHICCEVSPLCRNLLPGTTQEILDQCRQASFLRGFEDVVDGVAVRCLDQAPRVGFHPCKDGNACTIDTCVDTVTGACEQSFVPSDRIVQTTTEPIEPEGYASCDDEVNRGCGIQACDGFGHCTRVLSLRAAGLTTAACSGQNVPYCWDRACDGAGRCAAGAPHSERCRDPLGTLFGCPRPMECVVDSDGGGNPLDCTARAGCILDGRCVAEGAFNPENVCQVCRGWYRGGLDWAPQIPGTSCNPEPDVVGVCDFAGACRVD